jgi:hypothetical protein
MIKIDFFHAFASVVQWATVRMLLILSIALKLETMQVDYVSAFCQAPIESDVNVEMPRGCALLLQSPSNFFLFLNTPL